MYGLGISKVARVVGETCAQRQSESNQNILNILFKADTGLFILDLWAVHSHAEY